MKKLLAIFSTAVLLFSLILFSVPDAQARFGGGHSSSSHSSSSHSHSSSSHSSAWSSHSSSSPHYGSSHSSSSPHYGSSHSSSNNDANGFVLFIVIVIFLIIILYIVMANTEKTTKTVVSKNTLQRFDENQLITFKQQDANFSRILFLDFVHLLYVKYYRYYGKTDFTYLIPFLDNAVQHDKKLDLLISNQVIVISEIVINSVRLHLIDSTATEDRIVVEIEANYTIHPAFHTTDSGKQHTRYLTSERWFFQRAKGVLSPPPEKMQALTCPACGAPAHFSDAGQCGSCGTTIIKGQQQWYIKERYVLEQAVLQTGDLVSYADEEGTNLPSLTSKTILQEIANFEKQQGIVWSQYWDDFKQHIVQNYFLELNAAWTNRTMDKVRHLVSDRLYEANSFWIALYQQQGWQNRLDDLKVENIQLAKIEIDAYYEVITVRVFASCFDYTVDNKAKIIGGSQKKRRTYSEYWIFARRAGVEHSATLVNLAICPQCAAPADKMGQTAVCGYCGAKISTGEFSWVLFLITQDENYLG